MQMGFALLRAMLSSIILITLLIQLIVIILQLCYLTLKLLYLILVRRKRGNVIAMRVIAIGSELL